MTTLRVIADDILLPGGGPLAAYAAELTRALVATAPRGTDVAAVVAASPEDDYARVRELVPGLRTLLPSALARRELAAAWQHGFTVLPGSGMVHSTSLLAPLRRHDRTVSTSEQTVVTIHDALAWTQPELLAPRAVSWTKAMAKRAEKHADAVVVPTHATAAALEEHLDLGGRVRVIGAAPSTASPGPATDQELPERFAVVADGRVDGGPLTDAALGIPVVRVAPTDADRLAVFAAAAVVVVPGPGSAAVAALLDAFSLGAPVVAIDTAEADEISAGAAVLAAEGELVDAVRGLLDDATAAERAGVAGADRAKAFTWRDAAEKVWQLHADL